MKLSPHVRVSLLIVAALTLLVGCEEDVVAVLGTDDAYSLWGVLSPRADTQFVRVFPVEGTLNPGVAEPLDARFTSVDLDTGEERRWRDSVLVNEQGIVGHVFYAPLRVVHEHTYRLRITGGDGQASTVEVEVPVQTDLTLAEPDTTQGVLMAGYVLSNPPRLVRSELEFAVSYVVGFSASGCPIYTFIEYSLPYDDRVRRTEGGWWFLVNLQEVYAFVRDRADRDPMFVPFFGIVLGYARFQTIVVNEAWAPPGGVFDEDVLVQPGSMENVEDGFGFVGSGYRLSALWNLSPRVVTLAGFRATYADC